MFNMDAVDKVGSKLKLKRFWRVVVAIIAIYYVIELISIFECVHTFFYLGLHVLFLIFVWILALYALKKADIKKKLFRVFSAIIKVVGVVLIIVSLGIPYWEHVGGNLWKQSYLYSAQNDRYASDYYEAVFPEHILPISILGQWGLVNGFSEEFVVSCKYGYISEFDVAHCDLIEVSNFGKSGVIDRRGNVIVPCEYDVIGTYMLSRDGVGIIGKNGKYGLFNNKGEIVLPIIYDDVNNSVNEGAVQVVKDGMCGFADTCGNVIIPTMYEDSHSSIDENRAAVKYNGKWGFVDRDNNVVIPFQYESVSSFLYGGNARVRTFKGDEFYIDTAGAILPE